jgi:small-conductance mechanosensitive channel
MFSFLAQRLLMTLATTFFSRHERELTAALTVVLTLAIAVLTDRWVARRAARGALRPEIDTRVRFLRRLVALVIVVLGGLFALSQFGGLSRLATGVLASSAIVAAIVGFAARQRSPTSWRA